ncbi:hypothetical protein LOY46_07830 [Pseudomonas sichuanensis]|uniref:hypothetical protein n=1 Tax=Pseudomonas sichuanensis TaxID=2213015 RepID=UPI002160C2E6|nr:hypothetical protein [Pseudomonas sichuanensis]UVK84594.1 hypothetical protein LOY46_07830 [Pseudomonas sichuanensis]
MNYIKGLVIFTLATASVVFISFAQEAGSYRAKDAGDLGAIKISEKVGYTGDKCQLIPKEGDYTYAMGDTTCKSDQARYFSFDGVPSGVLVRFYDDRQCRETDGNWIFEVRTTQNPTTTGELELQAVFDREEGTVVAPGVKLEYKNLRGGDSQVYGKLSCTRIRY